MVFRSSACVFIFSIGSYRLDELLARALKLSFSSLIKVFPAFLHSCWATALVIEWLNACVPSIEDEWRLMRSKSLAWLRQELKAKGKEGEEAIMREKARKLFNTF